MKNHTAIRNEEGSVIVLAMIMLVLLTLLGIAATMTSSIEVQIASNERQATQNLYHAEAGDLLALESTNTWLTTTFLTSGDTVANYISGPLDIDGDGVNDTSYEVRCIEISGTPITGLSAGANELPMQAHIAPPPVNSGYSLKHFEVRKYGITATSISGNNQIQIGAYKVFNKY